MRDLDKYISILLDEFKKNDIEEVSSLLPEEKLLSLYAYYHYFNADNTKLIEILQGNVYNPQIDDHIAGMYIDEDSDDLTLDIVLLDKNRSDKLNYPGLLNYFKAAEDNLYQYFSKRVALRKKIGDILEQDEYKITESRPVKFVFVTDYVPKAGDKRKILSALNKIKPQHKQVSYSIIFGNDIEHEILEIENPKEYVDNGLLLLDNGKNCLYFGNEKSVVVNISALSLKKLYEDNYFRGLFAQNLRYYVKNVNVDSGVVATIKDNPGYFWYFNNGIIIICDDFSIQDNVLFIKKFSIVNGGQTTKLIGETEFENTFYVQCKIIKSNHLDGNEKIKFIADIAEASNTQKPIKTKDLIANRPEQRMLKKQLADFGIYCQIKRGEKINKRLYPEVWQNTTNEELGQFLLALVYQKPGAARGSKASICGNEERYNLIFGKVYNNAFIKDILFLKAYYKKWLVRIHKEYIKQDSQERDEYKESLAKNGLFFEIAIIGALAKLYYHPEYIAKINMALTMQQKLEILSQHDIDHGIFDHVDGLEDNLYELFEYCYINIYRTAYSNMKMMEPNKSHSYANFSKTDKNYMVYVMNLLIMRFSNGISRDDQELFDSVFYQASDEDKDRDKAILRRYVNVIGGGETSKVTDDLKGAIFEELSNYRTRKYKQLKVKPYDIFKNASRDRIAANAPQTITALQELNCLDEQQLIKYGEDIIKIVKKAIENLGR